MVAVSADRCVLRVTSDSTKGTTEAFAAAHVSRNHEVRADAGRANGALAGGWDARLRRSARDGDSEDSLPAVHHVISNFKALLNGTHHGVSVDHLQSYCDQFGWSYSHRKGDAVLDLLGDLVRWPHVNLGEIGECRPPMPKNPSRPEPGTAKNSALRKAWEEGQAECSQLDPAGREEVPREPVAALEPATAQEHATMEEDPIPVFDIESLLDDVFGKPGVGSLSCGNDYRETTWERNFFPPLFSH